MNFRSIQTTIATLAGACILAIVAALILFALYASDRTQTLTQARTQGLLEQLIEQRLSAEKAAAPPQTRLSQMFRDKQIWLAIAVYFVHQITIYTVIFFLPGIIGTYGTLSPFEIGLLTSVPWIAAAIGAATFPRLATTPTRCVPT